jgi:hypothetical protein
LGHPGTGVQFRLSLRRSPWAFKPHHKRSQSLKVESVILLAATFAPFFNTAV